MANNKHLSMDDRVAIEKSLDRHISFTAVGLLINKDASTISKEVRKHISCLKYGPFGRPFNSCIHHYSCQKTIYNYIDNCLFTARNINLPRKVIFKPLNPKRYASKWTKDAIFVVHMMIFFRS